MKLNERMRRPKRMKITAKKVNLSINSWRKVQGEKKNRLWKKKKQKFVSVIKRSFLADCQTENWLCELCWVLFVPRFLSSAKKKNTIIRWHAMCDFRIRLLQLLFFLQFFISQLNISEGYAKPNGWSYQSKINIHYFGFPIKVSAVHAFFLRINTKMYPEWNRESAKASFTSVTLLLSDILHEKYFIHLNVSHFMFYFECYAVFSFLFSLTYFSLTRKSKKTFHFIRFKDVRMCKVFVRVSFL